MIALVLAAALAVAGPAPTVAPKTLLGAWVLAQDGEGGPACAVTLKPAAAIGGFALAAAKGCARVLKRADDLYAWYVRPDGGLNFADPTRKTLLGFSKDSGGGWSTAGEEAIRYLLTRPTHELTQAERMRGHWRLVALGGAPLCDFDIASNPAGSAGTLKPRGACKAPWAGRAFAGWSLKAGRITLADPAGKAIVAIGGCGLGGCVGETPSGDFIGFTPIFE